MSTEIFANNATTTLGSSATSGATTMTLLTGTGTLFPTLTGSQYFTATLWSAGSTTGVPNEIVHVTSITGDTCTVIRGQEGTTASAWNVGDTFANYPTAAWANNTAGEADIQLQAGNSATDSGSANAGVITLAPAITSLSQVLLSPIRVLKVSAANTAGYTLNVNGLGAHAVTLNGSGLVAGQLPGSKVFEVFWDGAGFELLATQVFPNAMLFPMASDTVKANLTGSTATPQDVTLSALSTALGLGGAASISYPSGYLTLPDGGILQWSSGSASSGTTVNFPETFPTKCVWVGVTDGGNDPLSWSADRTTYTTTGFTIHNNLNTSGTFAYLAIGE